MGRSLSSVALGRPGSPCVGLGRTVRRRVGSYVLLNGSVSHERRPGSQPTCRAF